MSSVQGKTIAVTGASGMIGVYICRSLIAAGAKVVGVVRNPEKAAFLAAEGVEFRKADLADVPALTEAFKGCDAVVANAAMYVSSKTMGAWKAHEDANLGGTRNVYQAAHDADVKRIIQISTFGIYRWSLFDNMDEQRKQLKGAKHQGGAYRATKQMSEILGWELAKELGLEMTALRPSLVYGARDNNTLRPMYRFLKFKILPVPSISLPFVYAGDVADGVVGALANDASIGESYNVCGAGHQFSDFLQALIVAKGRGPRLFSAPLPIAIRADSRKAQREIGFHNRPIDVALREIVLEERG
jgi:nucleoside-diphosphate-sugar epimerase